MIDLWGSVLNMSEGWIPKGIHMIRQGSVAHISGGQVEGGLYVTDSTLTISGGLAGFPWDGRTGDELLARADEMALHSKRKGKNAITFGPGAQQICSTD